MKVRHIRAPLALLLGLVAGAFFLPIAHAKLDILSVDTDKILYFTQEQGRGIVTLHNAGTEPQSGKLRLLLESDLDHVSRVDEKDVVLAPGEQQTVRFEWKTGKTEFGHALCAELLDDAGQRLAVKRAYFTVADNVWKVAISGRNSKPIPVNYGFSWNTFHNADKYRQLLQSKEYERQLQDWAEGYKQSYCNYYEYFAWAPDDFFNLSPGPEREFWWSATNSYFVGREEIVKGIAALHRQGIRAITYANPYAAGDETFTVFREHPDWFVYDELGRPVPGFGITFSAQAYEILRSGKFDICPFDIIKRQNNSFFLNLAKLEVVDRGIDEIIATARMFGWDGVRWDNAFYRVWGKHYDFWGKRLSAYGDPDELTARNVKRVRTRISEVLGKRFVIGYNTGLTDRPEHPKGWEEVSRGGQLYMSEGPRASWQPTSSWNRWEDYYRYIVDEGNQVRSLGGHYLVIGFDQQHPIDQVYLQVLTFATGAHPYRDELYHFDDQNLPGEYVKLATRYAALIWDVERLKPLPDPVNAIRVTADGTIWWQETAKVRQLAERRRQIVLQLINPPAKDRIHSDDRPWPGAMPTVKRNVKVGLKLAKSETLSQAWLISAEPRLQCQALALTKGADTRAEVTVPELKIWSMVIFDIQ